MGIPEYIKCPHCEESIEMKKVCAICSSRVQALVNKYPEVFQETVFDRLNPKLEMILSEIQGLRDSIKDFKIRGLKLKSAKIQK